MADACRPSTDAVAATTTFAAAVLLAGASWVAWHRRGEGVLLGLVGLVSLATTSSLRAASQHTQDTHHAQHMSHPSSLRCLK